MVKHTKLQAKHAVLFRNSLYRVEYFIGLILVKSGDAVLQLKGTA